MSVSDKIDLRGQNALEAVDELEMFIDSCILSKESKITIIHGKGTGVLRKEISEYLSGHKYVSSFRLGTFGEWESGVTIANLKI
jgi:DNA mismatch repair protein MutS2